jgi:hypothetical protein
LTTLDVARQERADVYCIGRDAAGHRRP